MISILYFSNSVVRGGAEEHILGLLKGLDRTLFQPHLAATPEVIEELRPDLPADVELLPVRLSSPRHTAAARLLWERMRKPRVHILHSHLFYASLYASPIGWLGRVPLMIETPHLREAWRKGGIKGSYFIDRMAGRFVDHYIAVSEANARYLIEQKGLPARKVTVIQNGCDLSRFEPGHPVPHDLRRSLGFGEHDPVLLVLARLEPQKGHSVLLDALPAVRQQFPTVRLVCAGTGALLESLENQCKALGLTDAVRFVGYQSNPEDWLALADVVVLPSLFEGLPLVAIESLAAGKCMVATAVDGTPEVILNGATGLTVPPGMPGPLSEALCKALQDPQLRADLGQAGRTWVLSRFSKEQQLRKTQDFYVRELERRCHLVQACLCEQDRDVRPPAVTG